MRRLDSDRMREVWIRRRDILIDVITLLERKPDSSTWTGSEWRTYRYAKAISRRLSTTN